VISALRDRLCRGSGPIEDITIPLAANDVLEALSNRRRREVLRRLAGAPDDDPGVPLGELADHVAAIENDTSIKELSKQQRKNAYVGLYQSHIPTLERLDIVAVDEANVVQPTVDPQSLAGLLTVIEDACTEAKA